MKVTKEEIKEYRELCNLVNKSLLRMKEIDSKVPRNSKGGGNYPPTSTRDTNVNKY